MMILQIESSARMEASASRQLSAEIASRLAARSPGAELVVRDLAAQPLPHVDDRFVSALVSGAPRPTPTDQAALARSEALIRELEAAAAVVLGVPMYNYSVPSAFKAWIDHVVRARRTFRHTASGPVGLLADRPVWIATASGGVYGRGPAAENDFLVPYLRVVLGKIGLRSVQVLAVEGLALEAPGSALARALDRLDALLPVSAV